MRLYRKSGRLTYREPRVRGPTLRQLGFCAVVEEVLRRVCIKDRFKNRLCLVCRGVLLQVPPCRVSGIGSAKQRLHVTGKKLSVAIRFCQVQPADALNRQRSFHGRRSTARHCATALHQTSSWRLDATISACRRCLRAIWNSSATTEQTTGTLRARRCLRFPKGAWTTLRLARHGKTRTGRRFVCPSLPTPLRGLRRLFVRLHVEGWVLRGRQLRACVQHWISGHTVQRAFGRTLRLPKDHFERSVDAYYADETQLVKSTRAF